MRTRSLIIAGALALSGCGDSNNDDNKDAAVDTVEDAQTEEVSKPDASALTINDQGCADILQQTSFPTFELEIDPSEWAALQGEFKAQLQTVAFHPATVKVGNETVNDAAVRLTGPTWTWTGAKPPLMIAFDRTNPAGRFHGLRGIELQASPADHTFLRNRLALALMRSAGMAAQCANNASVTVNGSSLGVYASAEPLDQSFIERVYGSASNGIIWLYGWQPSKDAALWTNLERFNAAKDVSALQQVCDLEESVKEWAWEAVLPQGNGFWGTGESYALYEDPTGRRFQYIPYDFSTAFDSVPQNADPIMWSGAWVVGQPTKLLAVVHDPTWSQKYLDAVNGAAALYQPTLLKNWLDGWEAQIGAAVDQDQLKGFGTTEHATAVSTLRSYFIKRAIFLSGWVQCMSSGTGTDWDQDGTPSCRDCNDKNRSVHPGAEELCGNHVDDDCNGRIDDGCPGVDGGWISPIPGGGTDVDGGVDAAPGDGASSD